MDGRVDLLELFRFVGGALRGQRLRSFLSALGVAIGVTAGTVKTAKALYSYSAFTNTWAKFP